MDNCEEFVRGFNLDSPWNNPDIKNVMENIMTIFADEATKLYEKNDETFLNKTMTNYSDVINHMNTNHKRYTTKYVFVPIEFIGSFSKMLTDKTNYYKGFGPISIYNFIYGVNLYYQNRLFHEHIEKNICSILDSANISFNDTQYQEQYVNIIRTSLKGSFDDVNKSRDYDFVVRDVFEDKCRAFYHVVLGYIDMLEHMSKDAASDRTVMFNYTYNFPTNYKNMEKIYKIKKCEANGNIYIDNSKKINRINEYKEYMNKFACDVVAYGYIVEKLKSTKLKSLKPFNQVNNNQVKSNEQTQIAARVEEVKERITDMKDAVEVVKKSMNSLMVSSNDANLCGVCFERGKNRAFYKCGHNCCNVCADAIMQSSKLCPFCRVEIMDVIPAFT